MLRNNIKIMFLLLRNRVRVSLLSLRIIFSSSNSFSSSNNSNNRQVGWVLLKEDNNNYNKKSRFRENRISFSLRLKQRKVNKISSLD
jgi:hypothetical protein